MEGIVSWLAPVLVLLVAIFVLAFLWETGRRAWYWMAAKIYGWSEEEKFEHETAWIDRSVARDERLAQKDAAAARNVPRKWQGITFTTLAISALAFQTNLPWWSAALVVIMFAIGSVMAAGLAWRWYS